MDDVSANAVLEYRCEAFDAGTVRRFHHVIPCFNMFHRRRISSFKAGKTAPAIVFETAKSLPQPLGKLTCKLR